MSSCWAGWHSCRTVPKPDRGQVPVELTQAFRTDAARQLASGLILDGFTSAPVAESPRVRGASAPASAPDLLSRRVEAGEANDDEVYCYLCGKLFEGKIFQAQAVLSGLAPSRTGTPRIRLLVATIAYRQNRLEAAEEILEEILIDQPDHATALFNLAQIAAEQGKPDQANRCSRE